MATSKQQYQKRLEEMNVIVNRWNLTEISDYVMCKNEKYICNFLGFDSILQRFNTKRTPHKDFNKGKREFEIGDRSERTQKGLDIVIFLCRHPRSNVRTMLGIQTFLKTYGDVIQNYDKSNSTKYREKLLSSFRKGLLRLEAKAKKTSPR